MQNMPWSSKKAVHTNTAIISATKMLGKGEGLKSERQSQTHRGSDTPLRCGYNLQYV